MRFRTIHRKPAALAAIGLAGLVAIAASCERKSAPAPSSATDDVQNETAPAPLSDEQAAARAVELVESSLEAMGGREAWENTRYLVWKHFTGRRTTWNRQENRARIDLTRAPRDRPSIVLIDLDTKTGQAIEFGYERTGDDLAYIMDMASKFFEEDRYWLLMPYMLRDQGTSIRYLGTQPTMDDQAAEVIEVTFDNIGPNPFGKYHVYFDPETKLVVQWDSFSRVADTEAQFSTIWGDWQRYGEIMLAGDRGMYKQQESRFTELAAFDELPETVFTDFAIPEFVADLEAAEQAKRDGESPDTGDGDAAPGDGG